MVYPPYRDLAMRLGPLAVFVDLQEFRMRREQVNTIAHDASVKVDKHHHHFGLQGHLVARQMAAAARETIVTLGMRALRLWGRPAGLVGPWANFNALFVCWVPRHHPAVD